MAHRRRRRERHEPETTKSGLPRKGFTEALHPRGGHGQFADKPGAGNDAPKAPPKPSKFLSPTFKHSGVTMDDQMLIIHKKLPGKPGEPTHETMKLVRDGMTIEDYLSATAAQGIEPKQALLSLAGHFKSGRVVFHSPGASAHKTPSALVKGGGIWKKGGPGYKDLPKSASRSAVEANTDQVNGGPIHLGAPHLVSWEPPELPPVDEARWSKALVHDQLESDSSITREQVQKLVALHERTGISFIPRTSSTATGKAVNYYVGSGHGPLNRSLRKGTPLNQDEVKHTKLLDAMISKSTFQEDTVLWRGVGHTSGLNDMPPPELVADAGFMSASFRPRVAYSFAGKSEKASAKNAAVTTLVRIRVPKGTNGAMVGRNGTVAGSMMDEAEVMLPRGTHLRIIGDRQAELDWSGKGPLGVHIIDAEVVTVPKEKALPGPPPQVESTPPPFPGRARFL